MKKNTTCESPLFFVGRWKKTQFCEYINGEWVVTERYGAGTMVFIFLDENVVVERCRLGTRTPKFAHRRSGCGYIPRERLLWIDRSDYEPDGFLSVCLEERYRVEPVNQDEAWLIILDEVENEPDDYRMKFKVIRDKKYRAGIRTGSR